MGFTLFERWSPEYALNNAIEDVKASGLDGLNKHLTSKARKSIEDFNSLSNMSGVSLVSTLLMGGDAVGFLLEKLSEFEWTVKEVMKGTETSAAIVGFDYEDKIVGSIELTMIKEDKTWKIDSFSKPKFDKISLPQGDAGQSAE